MDALDVVKVCLRRWWVFVPVVALALGAGLGIVRGQTSSYQSFASFALVYEQPPGRDARDPDPRVDNPLAEEGGALLGEAILAELGTSARQRELGDPRAAGAQPGADAHGTRYAVTLPTNSSSYYVTTWSDDEQAARQTIEAVLEELPTLTRSIQDRAGAPLLSQYSPFITTSPQVSEVPPGSPAKIMIGVLGIGLLAGAALAVLADFLLQRRKTRRTAPASPALPVEPEVPPADGERGARGASPTKKSRGKPRRVVPMDGRPRDDLGRGFERDERRKASG